MSTETIRRISGAQEALDAYTAFAGGAEADEPLDWQISDLMTDLLHLAAARASELEVPIGQILHRVVRDFGEEQAEDAEE